MNDNNNNSKDIAVALDIGTTKVCAIAGYLNEYGKIEVLGVGSVKSEGVSRGVVSNIDKTVRAIKEAVEIAERTSGLKFRLVHVGIAGQHIKSLHHQGLLVRHDANDEISTEDVERLIKDMHKLVLPPGDKILHVIPQEFTVDDEQDIIDPVGMSGIRLKANFHIITGQISASRNIMRCVEKAGLDVADVTLEPIASAASILSLEEKEAGVALVDIGGGTTDITIFKDGIIRHTAVIPFGGNAVTKDIREGCTVMMDQAERLKVKFGSAMAEEIYDNRIITIPGFKGRDHKAISELNLARIIQARIEEIFDYVLWEIKRSGYESKLIAGIVLTGGGSLLKNINILAESHTGLGARVGMPVEHLAHGYSPQLASPIYATAVGLLKNTIENMQDRNFVEIREESTDNMVEDESEDQELNNHYNDDNNGFNKSEPKKRGKWFNKVFSLTKDFFEATPDSEF
ncbi:MAG: cell division protein FtsA [Saprospiraceae bacterium]